MRVLALESSCDELAAAILDRDGKTLLANLIHSQISLHARFGGVVPEVASRDHVREVDRVVKEVLTKADLQLSDLDAVAATRGPGLIGCLHCGLEYVKGLSVGTGLPFVGVHHLEAHLAAADLEPEGPALPFIALLVSGGHTHLFKVEHRAGPHLLLGATRDDAAGEAFDKTAKLLGLGYPGGAVIDRRAERGDKARFSFPQLMANKGHLDFSFSGLKTAAHRMIKEASPLSEQDVDDFCAGFQNTVVTTLLRKAFQACRMHGVPRLVLAGGVAANSQLREEAAQRGPREQIQVFLPARAHCTDNAAMVARAAWVRLQAGHWDDVSVVAKAHWALQSA